MENRWKIIAPLQSNITYCLVRSKSERYIKDSFKKTLKENYLMNLMLKTLKDFKRSLNTKSIKRLENPNHSFNH